MFLLCFRARLFIDALWSPAGKGLTSWLSFVVSNCKAVAAYLKVVRRRKASSADGTRGGEHERVTPPLVGGLGGLPQENFEFLALLCARFQWGFMRLGPDFRHDFLHEKIFLGA